MRKQADSDLLPLAVLPLLRSLRAALRPAGHKPLADRLKSVLVQRLASCKPALAADLALPALESDTAPLQARPGRASLPALLASPL